MDFKQLEIFIAVVDHMSFSKAARQLFLTQPTVSANIAALEAELNTCFIKRTTKRFEVTAAGYQLYDHAIAMLQMRNQVYQQFLTPSQKIIEIGASTIPSSYILPEILPRFSKENPSIYFQSRLSDSMGVIEAVKAGKIDLGLVGTKINDDDLLFTSFFEDTLVIVTPVTPHYIELFEKKATLADLIHEPFILREKGSGTKKEMDRYLENKKITSRMLHVVARMNDLEAVKKSIMNGLGISILSAKSVQDLEKSHQILIFPLDNPAPTRKLYIVQKKQIIPAAHMKEFIRFLCHYYQSN